MDWTSTHPTLLARLKDPADAASWREFDRRYGELMLRYACSCGLQRADAEDVRQAVLLSLAGALKGFQYSRDRGRFRDYLGRAVRNAVTRWKSRGVCPAGPTGVLFRIEETDLVSGQAGPVDDLWEREWVRHHCRVALGRLRATHDEQSLRVFELLLSGNTPEETARQVGMTVDAVVKVKQRVRNRMRELIAEQVRDEDRGPDER